MSEDEKENEKIYEVMRWTWHATGFKTIKSKDIQVGDLIKIYKDEFFPCDMFIMTTPDEKGQCYIETKNLDGETNKKIKFAKKEI